MKECSNLSHYVCLCNTSLCVLCNHSTSAHVALLCNVFLIEYISVCYIFIMFFLLVVKLVQVECPRGCGVSTLC